MVRPLSDVQKCMCGGEGGLVTGKPLYNTVYVYVSRRPFWSPDHIYRLFTIVLKT